MWIGRVTAFLALFIVACAPPAPAQPTAAPRAAPSPQAARAPTAVKEAPSALRLVPIRVDETLGALATPEPLRKDLAPPRATPQTAEPGSKFLTITFAIENTTDATRLVGIAGSDRTTTNLAGATLTARDGTRYTAVRSFSTLGLRTAASRAATNYPVLLSLRPGFRAVGEATDSIARFTPVPNSVTFKVPATMSDYGTLTIPPLTDFGARQGDAVADQLRRLTSPIEPLDLAGIEAGPRAVQYPSDRPMSEYEPIGTPVTLGGNGRLTIVGTDIEQQRDFRARAVKYITTTMRFRNEGAQEPQNFEVSAQFFGSDGIVYVGALPAVGSFSASSAVPEPRVILGWHGRTAASDIVQPNDEMEVTRRLFLVPESLTSGVLVLSGGLDATFAIEGIKVP